jgi:prolyl-tRNA editing enzyme YbaK/EbsC (Cys-tRNA(Pro) deacylase)
MLEDFLEVNNVKAKIIETKNSVHTALEASRELKVPLTQIVKTILLIDSKGFGVLCLVLGNSRVCIEKASKIVGEKLRIASPKEVEEITGYKPGELPPISVYGVKTLIDFKIEKKKTVFCGGGKTNAMLEISPQQIIEFAQNPVLCDIAK